MAELTKERTYEPPLGEIGAELIPGQEGDLAPGVTGYAVLSHGKIWIPWMSAKVEGSGDVGRFLDSLSPRCVVPTVISPRLAGMLLRRGFAPHIEQTEDGPCEVWSR
jgi:hypothetical protein